MIRKEMFEKSQAFDMSRFQVVQGNRGSTRSDLLDRFLERLNPPRLAAGYRPLSHGRLAAMFKGVPTGDLYPFFKDCERANDFSRFFWWSFKERDKKETQGRLDFR